MMKKEYKAPALTVVAFRAERGFANSVVDNVAEQINGYSSFVLENGSVQDWGDGEDQIISGDNMTGDGTDGLAAGYFGQQDASGWFN